MIVRRDISSSLMNKLRKQALRYVKANLKVGKVLSIEEVMIYIQGQILNIYPHIRKPMLQRVSNVIIDRIAVPVRDMIAKYLRNKY